MRNAPANGKNWEGVRLKKEKQELMIKGIQYLMLIAVFAFSLILPGYGARKQSQESAADEIVQAKEQENKGTIVVDAGHGGRDPGVTGASGADESTLNLVYAKKLEELLVSQGYRVVQTRDSEAGLYDEDASNKKAQDMQRRCAIIEEEQPLLTVSIHQNSYPQDTSVCGPQVFYYEHSPEGEKLASYIQNRLNERLEPPKKLAPKSNDTYYILKRSASTTVIVECGFLTNPEEEAKLQDESYQEKAVSAICEGIQEYLEGQAG